MFVERLAQLPEILDGFIAGPPAIDRAAWDELPAAVRQQLVAEGEAALATDYPPLLATAYLDYTRTGDRARFEASYFTRRRTLNALILAECVEHRGRFLDRVIDGLMLICEESGWQLPAHNSQVRGGPRAALADVETPIIDLFAAETGAQLAVAVHLLGAELEAVAPEIAVRIDHELERRIFTPYLTRHFWWMGNGDEPMNNWTAWCTQNLLIAVFSRPTEGDVRRRVAEQAAASLDAFLKDYGEDGACEEGVVYYRHAGLCLFNALAVLDAVAPEAFGPLWREPKLKHMAEYIVRMHVGGRRYFNFADSSAVVERCGAREYLFGRAVGSTLLADFAGTDWAVEKRVTLPDEINLFYRVQLAFAAAELEAHRSAPIEQPDCYLPSVGLMIARDDRFA
ncbi:MAG TPA: heparinase, partial [Devosia sp.]